MCHHKHNTTSLEVDEDNSTQRQREVYKMIPPLLTVLEEDEENDMLVTLSQGLEGPLIWPKATSPAQDLERMARSVLGF